MGDAFLRLSQDDQREVLEIVREKTQRPTLLLEKDVWVVWTLGALFDSVLGKTSFLLTGGPYQRTAYLHVNYRKIVPIEKELQVEAGVSRTEGRKIFVEMRLCDGSDVLADGEGLFVRLKPGQP